MASFCLLIILKGLIVFFVGLFWRTDGGIDSPSLSLLENEI
jgi:hypothetical protein